MFRVFKYENLYSVPGRPYQFSSSHEEHLQRLDMILTRLKEHGIKLSPETCFFLQKMVNLLGHTVGEEGIETDSTKTDTIKLYYRPSNSDEQISSRLLPQVCSEF